MAAPSIEMDREIPQITISEERLEELLENQRSIHPVVYYPPSLPTHRTEGRLFSAPQTLEAVMAVEALAQLTVHESKLSTADTNQLSLDLAQSSMPGVSLHLVQEQPNEQRLAA